MRAREGKVLDVTAGYAVASIRFIRRIDIFEAFRASGDPRSSRGRGLRGVVAQRGKRREGVGRGVAESEGRRYRG